MSALTLFALPEPCVAKGEPDGCVVAGAHRLGPRQAAIWSKIIDAPTRSLGADMAVRASMDPCFVEEIMGARLYAPFGLFREIVPMHGPPRVAALLHDGGVPVAHALLVPTTATNCFASPIPRRLGIKTGLIGVFVAEEHRGRGHARRCLAALARHLEYAGVWPKPCLAAEARIVPLCRSVFRVPVLARWNGDRAEDEQGTFADARRAS